MSTSETAANPDGPAPVQFYRASEAAYGCFSNLFECEVVFDNLAFRSAEDAYQFGKPRHDDARRWILGAPTPANAAAAAHCLPVDEIVPDWDETKVARMYEVLLAKFFQHDDLRRRLLDSGSAAIVEVSKTDSFWGAGANGRGLNVLGRLLESVRTALREPGTHNSGPPSLPVRRQSRGINGPTLRRPAAHSAPDNDDELFFRSADASAFLSTYFPCRVRFDGKVFPNAEFAYQYGKPSRPEVADWLARCPPRLLPVAKDSALMRWDVRRDWGALRSVRVHAVLLAKFSQHDDLRKQLLDTSPRTLVATGSRGKRGAELAGELMRLRDELAR